MPPGIQVPAKALNVRPVSPELRAALRALARAEGLRLYPYVIRVLQAHVVRQWQVRDRRQKEEALAGHDTNEGP